MPGDAPLGEQAGWVSSRSHVDRRNPAGYERAVVGGCATGGARDDQKRGQAWFGAQALQRREKPWKQTGQARPGEADRVRPVAENCWARPREMMAVDDGAEGRLVKTRTLRDVWLLERGPNSQAGIAET